MRCARARPTTDRTDETRVSPLPLLNVALFAWQQGAFGHFAEGGANPSALPGSCNPIASEFSPKRRAGTARAPSQARVASAAALPSRAGDA
jgi:hypothetical protein